jgi:hypothetical protein
MKDTKGEVRSLLNADRDAMLEVMSPETTETTNGTVKIIAGVLVIIAALIGFGVFEQHQSLSKQAAAENAAVAQEKLRCAAVVPDAFAESGCKWEYETDAQKAALDKEVREISCSDTLQQYGIESEATKQACRGSKLGKKLGL